MAGPGRDLTRIKAARNRHAHNRAIPCHWRKRMKLQQIFEQSENAAVAAIVAIFIVLHFGLLYLFTHV